MRGCSYGSDSEKQIILTQTNINLSMISNLAYVHPDAKIGKNVTIEPFAYVEGDVVIGDD